MEKTRRIASARPRVGLQGVAIVLLSASLIAAGCGDKFQGSGPVGPTPPSSNTSSLTWVITDGCNDGKGLQVRFHDLRRSLAEQLGGLHRPRTGHA
jgi:hypothetical protein